MSYKRIAIVVILVVVVAGAYYLMPKSKIYAEAAGHKVYKNEVDDLINGSKNLSTKDAATVLADKYLAEALIKDNDISVGEDEVKAAYSDRYQTPLEENKLAYQKVKNEVYLDKIAAKQRGYIKGQFVIAMFNRYVAFQSPVLEQRKKELPGLGDAKLIAQDRQYAQDFINKTSTQLQNGALNFDQAIQAEHQDPRLGETAYRSQQHSGNFDTSQTDLTANTVVTVKSANEAIGKMKARETSKPFVVSVANSVDGQTTADSYFLIVKLDEVKPGSGGEVSFDDYLISAKQRLGYKIYE